MWVVYALLSASFAALTAIFAKVGVQHMDSNLATAIRTGIILIITWSIVFFTGSYKSIPGLAGRELLFFCSLVQLLAYLGFFISRQFSLVIFPK